MKDGNFYYQSSDEELIELISSTGNQGAFTEIVRRYKSRIASTVYGMLGKCEEAEDIGQEVFIRFYRSVQNFRGESSLGTYLTRIAINLSLNEIKRREIRRFFSFEAMEEEGIEIADPDSERPFDGKKEAIQRAISRLPEKLRAVVVLRLIDEYSTEETAQILGVPVGTVLSRLSRAQDKLRKYLLFYRAEK